MNIDILGLLRSRPVDRRIGDGVVHERHDFLRGLVPAPCIVCESAVIAGINAERIHDRRLVVRRTAHPAIAEPRPGGDRLLLLNQFVSVRCGPEVFVRIASVPGVRWAGEHRLLRGVMQCVVQPGERSRGVAERGVVRDLVDPFTIEEHGAPVPEALPEILAGERPA